ncbi:hypothetical protein [Egicoccus sp. AB-alg2]|uniref:hypothetical protein n=1 Tax=Egicoccus sp. AB-alg2 TaxID=3242693 RepID=UPI00359D5231
MGHVGSSRRAARWGAAVLACALVAPPAASAVTGTEAAAWAADDDARRAAAASLDTEVTTVPGRWIVRAVDGRLDEALAAARGLGVGVDDHFASTINGFAATGNERLATRLRAEPSVQSVRPVQRIAFAATQASAPWNLDRIDQPKRPLDRTYTYAETGKGVHVYVIDSGVRADHAEFGGRVVTGLRG